MPYHHFTVKEQYVIAHLTIAGYSQREIGRRLGRHHTSISREIKRNRPTYAEDAVYWYDAAEQYAKERRRRPRHRRRQHEGLVSYVTSKLRLDWSPEAIAGRMKVDYPDDNSMRICHETIYRWIYRDSLNKGDLHHHLRRRHKYRRRQKRYGSGRRFIPGRVSIDVRPSVVATRERFGDWEGDTVEGGKGTGHLATHVERKCRYLLAAKLINKKASTMTAQSVALFRTIPQGLRHTLTVDNEFYFRDVDSYVALSASTLVSARVMLDVFTPSWGTWVGDVASLINILFAPPFCVL